MDTDIGEFRGDLFDTDSEDEAESPAPSLLKAELREHQQAAVDFLVSRPRAFLACGPGAGKTVIALAAICRKRAQRPETRPTLIVVPAMVRAQWRAEVMAHTRLASYVVEGNVRGTLSTRVRSPILVIVSHDAVRSDVILPPRERLRKSMTGGVADFVDPCSELMSIDWQRIIIDETHVIRDKTSFVSRAILRLAQRIPERWAMSGTPVVNKSTDVLPVATLLGASLPSDSPRNVGKHDWAAFRREYMFCYNLDGDRDVEMGLPTLHRANVMIPLDETSREEYAQTLVLCFCLAAWAHSRRFHVELLVALTRLQQFTTHPLLALATRENRPDRVFEARSPKLERLRLEIASCAAGDKVLIYTRFAVSAEMIRLLLERDGHRCVLLRGTVPVRRRNEILETFRKDATVRCLISTLKCGGEAYNIQVANKVIVAESWYNDAQTQQAIKRAHRLGQTREVEGNTLVVADTLDEALLNLHQKKLGQAAAVCGTRPQEVYKRKLGIDEAMSLVKVAIALFRKAHPGVYEKVPPVTLEQAAELLGVNLMRQQQMVLA